jgi:hypothetical protein
VVAFLVVLTLEFVTFALFSKKGMFQLFGTFSNADGDFSLSLGEEKISAETEGYDSWRVSKLSLIHFIWNLLS